MPNTRRRRGSRGGSRRSTWNERHEEVMSEADEVMNRYGCGKIGLDNINKCIDKLVDLWHDPNKTAQERRDITSDLRILNPVFLALSMNTRTRGGSRKQTRRQRRH